MFLVNRMAGIRRCEAFLFWFPPTLRIARKALPELVALFLHRWSFEHWWGLPYIINECRRLEQALMLAYADDVWWLEQGCAATNFAMFLENHSHAATKFPRITPVLNRRQQSQHRTVSLCRAPTFTSERFFFFFFRLWVRTWAVGKNRDVVRFVQNEGSVVTVGAPRASRDAM